MQRYDAIENGIVKNDVKALREAIGSICYTNRDLSNGEFFEVVKYVESKGIQLKDAELVGAPTISSQKSEFTDEDFAKAIFELKRNFCDARIQDVRVIGEKLYAKKAPVQKVSDSKSDAGQSNSTKKTNGTGTLPNHRSHQRNSNKTPMVIGLVAVIVIIIIIVLLVTTQNYGMDVQVFENAQTAKSMERVQEVKRKVIESIKEREMPC